MTILTGARVVTPGGVLLGGLVRVEGTSIAEVREPRAGEVPGSEGEPVEHLDAGWLLPGFVDLHVHGGGGHDLTTSPEAMASAVAYHRSHGTTRTLVSLITASVADLATQATWAAELVRRGPSPAGHVVGIHLEGPFLCQSRRGAQHPSHIVAPDPGAWETLYQAGDGHVRTVTLAPELPGALDLIDRVVAAGATAAVGHTEATYDQAMAAFDRGARLLTHAYNAMRPPHHREPGPVPAALDSGATCEIINDGAHVHPAAVRLLLDGHTDQVALMTDAIDATGMGDGQYRLGGQQVVVRDGLARLVADGALAGSTLTMDEALRRAVVEVGVPIVTASAMASGTPARLLGVDDRCGAIAAGLDADLVWLDEDYRLRRVMAQGRWIDEVG